MEQIKVSLERNPVPASAPNPSTYIPTTICAQSQQGQSSYILNLPPCTHKSHLTIRQKVVLYTTQWHSPRQVVSPLPLATWQHYICHNCVGPVGDKLFTLHFSFSVFRFWWIEPGLIRWTISLTTRLPVCGPYVLVLFVLNNTCNARDLYLLVNFYEFIYF